MTTIISHRGNLYGPNSCMENSPEAIHTAIQNGFSVEVDVKAIYPLAGIVQLGHDDDSISYYMSIDILDCDEIVLHAKTVTLLNELISSFNYADVFFHDNDDCTLTRNGNIWIHPEYGITDIQDAIHVLPEHFQMDKSDKIEDIGKLSNIVSPKICTDYPIRYRELFCE